MVGSNLDEAAIVAPPTTAQRTDVVGRRLPIPSTDSASWAGVAVPSDLLQTKLRPPRLRRPTVPRPRLSARLNRSWDCTLALVSAPAGFGKTTLLAEWLSSGSAEGRALAWLSLDQRDNDPASFWCYVVAALHAASTNVGTAALALLQSSVHAGLGRLLNDLQDLHDLVLVLDDYHVIDALDVHEQMVFFLDHLPGNVHVVLATRVDPALPLARLRARGELVEVRAADLRFTPEEASSYLCDTMGLSLTQRDVEALDGRTEGWIAALQMAALSMQGRDDVADFIAGFSGDDRYIVDYLAQEVLQRQPAQLRSFLLETSLLSRLTGPLCDAVTGRDGGKATLEELDRKNLFVVALDDQRRWYRYHHLFADVLQAHLMDEHPDRVGELHLRASEWYDQQGDPAEAIDHAMAGGHFARAAVLVERALPAVRRDRQEVSLRRWLGALPDELVRASPALSLGYAGALMAHAEVEGVEVHLQHVEQWLAGIRSGASATTDAAQDRQLRTLPGAVAMYRAGLARIHGDVAGTMRHARLALDLAAEDDDLERGGAAALLGLAHWEIGELGPACELYAQALASLNRAGHLPDTLGCTIALADLETAQGRLSQACGAYERALQAADEAPRVPRGTADMHVGIASLLVERNQLAAAVQHLSAAEALGEHAALPQNRYRWRVVASFVREADSDPIGALALLADAERLYDTDYSPDVRPVAALTARVWIRHGRTQEALAWARSRELAVDDELSYLREFEHLTLARLLLARLGSGAAQSAHELDQFLERLLRAAQGGGRCGSVLEILVLLTLTAQKRGDLTRAVATLQQAVTLAEPEGYVRIFAEHGAPMAALLRALERSGTAEDYPARLLAAVNQGSGTPPARTDPVESLSDRELVVLRLLVSDLDGPDIARQLVVSVNTVRTHTKNIYAKLGVNSRRAAVRRGHELELLPTHR